MPATSTLSATPSPLYAAAEAVGVRLAIHEVGTARMGRDPRDSVLNSFCQSWDVENLFVMDGSCFVSQGVQNPTLTMLALAARSCDYLVDRVKRGEL
jgi:choline dehydrogenase-like flavoprotein